MQCPSLQNSKAVPSSLPLVLSPDESSGRLCHFPQRNSAEFGPLILQPFLSMRTITVCYYNVFRINNLHAIKMSATIYLNQHQYFENVIHEFQLFHNFP